MSRTRPRMLAVVRCGDASLHRSWAAGHDLFDVAISYFGDDAERTFPEARYVHRKKAGKWDGVFDFFATFPDAADAYDYFWFPDDDIEARAEDIAQLIDIGREHDLALFQPALDRRSYYSHLITLRNSSFTLRYANFVEIMAPVLRKDLLARALPTMASTRSGFGLDFLWPQIAGEIAGDASRACAIIDAVQVTHTRPVGGALHAFMKASGGAPALDELAQTVQKVQGRAKAQIKGVPTQRIRVLGAIDRQGARIPGWQAAHAIALDLVTRDANAVQKIPALGVVRHALKVALL